MVQIIKKDNWYLLLPPLNLILGRTSSSSIQITLIKCPESDININEMTQQKTEHVKINYINCFIKGTNLKENIINTDIHSAGILLLRNETQHRLFEIPDILVNNLASDCMRKLLNKNKRNNTSTEFNRANTRFLFLSHFAKITEYAQNIVNDIRNNENNEYRKSMMEWQETLLTD